MRYMGPREVWRHNLALIVFLVMVAGFSWITWQLRQETLTVSRSSYARCENRNINIERQNRFNRAMAKLEASNRFIDQPFRDARVRLYNGVILQPADCGKRP